MKVSELADELGVPTSAVLEQCQRFGIAASWAGAELRGADLVVLRAELAAAEAPLDLRPADHEAVWPEAIAKADPHHAGEASGTAAAADGGASTDAAGSTEAAGSADAPASVPPHDPADRTSAVVQPLPPTAVGSMPGLIDEVTPTPPPESVIHGPLRTSDDLHPIDDQGVRRIPPRPPAERKAIPRPARNALLWLVLAVAAFAGSNATDNPFLILGLWVVALVAFAVTIYDGNRGRRAISTHPDRMHGQWLAIPAMALGILGVAGMVLVTSVAIREQPAADAPMGAGELTSVQGARWGYQRVTRIADEGWHQPAKEAQTCWDRRGDEVRQEGRVELGNHRQRCEDPHTVEIVAVFAYDRDADSPFPGQAAIDRAVQERCGDLLEEAQANAEPGETVVLLSERPTVEGWDDGDHDIACALVTPMREGSLVE